MIYRSADVCDPILVEAACGFAGCRAEACVASTGERKKEGERELMDEHAL